MNRLEFFEVLLASGLARKLPVNPNDDEGLVKPETVVAFVKHKGIIYGLGFRLDEFKGKEEKGLEFLHHALTHQLRHMGIIKPYEFGG